VGAYWTFNSIIRKAFNLFLFDCEITLDFVIPFFGLGCWYG